MSLIEGFAVQKWIRDRGWTKETSAVAANKGGDDRRDVLQLIFNHLDTARRGKISLCAIRGALSMVKLSEDPARHAHLSESIISCFCASDQPKSAGGAVDFTQFADVMACQEQGRKFQTLQDELRSEDLAAAKAHFANIFRKEVVVRGLLDNGGAAGCMCSVFQMLFKAEGLAASSSDRARKLRLMEEAVEDRKARRLERKRAAQAKQKLVERPKLHRSSRLPVEMPSSLKITSKLPTSTVENVPSQSGVSQDDAETPQPKKDCDGAPSTVRRRLRENKGQPDMLQQNANISRARENIRLKREAIRQASEVLGLHYVPPSPPSTTSPATRIANACRGRVWWRGKSSSSISAGAAFAEGDRTRGKMVASARPGGFVRCPPASVRRLRLRSQHPSPAVGLPRGKRGRMPVFDVGASDLEYPENKGIKAFGVTSRRKDAILKRTPLCGRSANAKLPSWASCDNSACDPGNEWNDASTPVGKSAGAAQAPDGESPVRCGTGAATAGAPEQEAANICPVEGAWEEHDSASTLSHCANTNATVITAVVPTATKVEHSSELTTPGSGQGQTGRNSDSCSSLATVPGTTLHDPEFGGVTTRNTVDKSHHALELGRGKLLRSPRRPNNPTGKARSGSRPHGGIGSVRGGGGGGGESAAAGATAEKRRGACPNPWRTPLLVRCMRRPEPRGL